MSKTASLKTATAKPLQTAGASLILQRKCACGAGASGLTGECAECGKKLGLQTKLRINESGDVYEQEADRVAEQVLAKPAHPGVSSAPPRIQRYTGQATGQADTTPASVDQVLAGPGRPLDPVLRQDMERRFGHDFSRVRVHSSAAAEQSARDVNAHAYTVGHNIVFGAGRFAPGTQEGRGLIAHELTHVVQQSGAEGIRIGQSKKPSLALWGSRTGRAPIGRSKPAEAVLDFQRSTGNRAVGRLFRKEAVDVKGAAEKFGIGVDEEPPSDEVDAFLESRRSLYQVALVGTNVYVTLPRSHEWTARYTNRALMEGAVGAAINMIYMGGTTAAQARKAYQQVVGHGVKFTPAAKQKHGEGAVHMTIIDNASITKIAEALNLTPKYMGEKWRAKFGETQLIAFALGSAYKSFDRLVPHFSEKQLAAANMSVELIRYMLDREFQSMIEVAKRHPAAAPWREAYKRNLALHWAEREPVLEDLDKVSLSQWAKTILDLATATRKAIKEQIRRRREEESKHARNEHLRPHEIKVDNAATFILENFEPTHTERLAPNPWIVHGGQQLSNMKNEPIYLLRVEGSRVIYQHLGDKKFYEQSLEGFGEEQLYSIYAAAGEKSQGAIALSKWVLGVAGAVFPPVRYGLMATDVLNAAFKLQASREELERSYDSMKIAYASIDALVPGVLPKVWDAVLDKQNAALLNPLQNPDAGAWLKVLIRVVMMRQTRVVNASYAADAVSGFLKKAWAAVKKGLGVLWEVVKHVIVIGPAVAGSTGVSGHRALGLAQQRLKELGVVEALAIVEQIKGLPEGDQKRLVREIEDLGANGTKLIDIVKKAMSW